MGLRFSLKVICIVAVLSALVVGAHYSIRFVDAPEREVLATLLGAAATIFAGWLAWESLTMQAQRTEPEKIDRAKIRKEDAVVAIAPAVHASANWLTLIDAELAKPGDREGKSVRVKKSGRFLNEVIDRNFLVALMDELSADDRINLLMIVSTMRSSLALAQIHFDDELSSDDIALVRKAIAGLRNHLSRFDTDLHSVFLRDSGLQPEQSQETATR